MSHTLLLPVPASGRAPLGIVPYVAPLVRATGGALTLLQFSAGHQLARDDAAQLAALAQTFADAGIAARQVTHDGSLLTALDDYLQTEGEVMGVVLARALALRLAAWDTLLNQPRLLRLLRRASVPLLLVLPAQLPQMRPPLESGTFGTETPTLDAVTPYARLVVPLDGSEAAEQALPWAGAIARDGDATVILTAVTSQQMPFLPGRVGALLSTLRADATPSAPVASSVPVLETPQLYLDHIAKRLTLEGLHVRAQEVQGAPVESIYALAEAVQANLLVITAQGQHMGRVTPLGQGWGRVARELLRSSPIPVLIAQPRVAVARQPVVQAEENLAGQLARKIAPEGVVEHVAGDRAESDAAEVVSD